MKPISELGYEEARDELIDVVQRLEHGGLDLDASLALWERGEELVCLGVFNWKVPASVCVKIVKNIARDGNRIICG